MFCNLFWFVSLLLITSYLILFSRFKKLSLKFGIQSLSFNLKCLKNALLVIKFVLLDLRCLFSSRNSFRKLFGSEWVYFWQLGFFLYIFLLTHSYHSYHSYHSCLLPFVCLLIAPRLSFDCPLFALSSLFLSSSAW